MDDPALPERDLDAALRGLARLNRASRSWRAFAPVLRRACEGLRRSVRVLDVACGGGDNIAALMRWARTRGMPIECHACDVNPAMTSRTLLAMRNVEPRTPDSRTFVADVVRGEIPGEYDVVMNSLFLHHLTREDCVLALRAMWRSASVAMVVSDLVRSNCNWLQVGVASRVLTSSRVVRVDALRSVEAAWTVRELSEIAREAGVEDASVLSAFPARMLLTAWKSGERGGA
jgi:2-polyprenyl-3-methyl-5-hydroxy-6-metoxy-1,4-benzoquinol methylase